MFKDLWNTPLTSNSSVALEEVGVIREEVNATYGYRAYKYIQTASDTTVANGTALAYSDAYRNTATSDISDASQNQPLGVGIGAITATYYGWVQIAGYHSAILTDGGDDIADGDSLILSSTDGTVDSVAAGTASTYKIVGVAVAADTDASNTVAGMISCF